VTWSALRAAVNSPRMRVVAIVASLSAISGAAVGGVVALIGAAVLTPSEPVSGAQVAAMAMEYAVVTGVAGSALGTLITFGGLRRVPLGSIILRTNLGFAAGLTAGWLGGPWAWHHVGLLGFGGFCAGALLALVRSHGAPQSASLPSGAVADSGALAAEPPQARLPLPSPGAPAARTDHIGEYVRRTDASAR